MTGPPVSMEGDRYGTNPLYGGCQAYPPFPGLLRRELAPVRICALRFLQNSGILQAAGLFVSSGSGGETLCPPHEGCQASFRPASRAHRVRRRIDHGAVYLPVPALSGKRRAA